MAFIHSLASQGVTTKAIASESNTLAVAPDRAFKLRVAVLDEEAVEGHRAYRELIWGREYTRDEAIYCPSFGEHVEFQVPHAKDGAGGPGQDCGTV